MRRAKRPSMIANFAVTYRCDSRCRTCNIWKILDPCEGELSLEEIDDFFERNRSFLRDVRIIQITGGEPFLREDLPDVVGTIRRILPGCSFWIPTNGMNPELVMNATRTMLHKLDGKGLGVSVSVDGIGETHDAMRGVEGCYAAVLESLHALSSLRGERPRLLISVGMTVTAENCLQIDSVFRLSEEFGADFSLRPVNFSDIYYRNEKKTQPGMALDEIVPVIRRIARAHVKRHGLLTSIPTVRYLQGVVDYIRSPNERKLRCSAASDSMFIDPYGNVYPCIIMDRKMGNIRERPLEEIWLSEEAERTRGLIGDGMCPNCWVECEAFRDIRRDRSGLLVTALRTFMDPVKMGIR